MDEILGQSSAIDVLQSSLQSGRVHHAYIFHGPMGVGKFTAARAFARVLLCHDRQTELTGRIVACGACASCKLIDAPAPQVQGIEGQNPLGGAHPDLHVVTKELALFSDAPDIRKRKLTSIPVDVINQHVIGTLGFVAKLGHGKVVIVDEAELMQPVSQNALLKILEEPPAGSHIILVTSSEDKLLITIRSRCQRVAFVPLSDAIVSAETTRMHPKLNAGEVDAVVRFADGSLGRAMMAVEYGLVSWPAEILPMIDAMARGRFSAQLGTTIQKHIEGFAEAWVEHHGKANSSKEAANKLAASTMWATIARHLRRQLHQHAPTGGTAALTPAARASMDAWTTAIDAVQLAELQIASNQNLSLVCDHLVANLSRALSPLASQSAA